MPDCFVPVRSFVWTHQPERGRAGLVVSVLSNRGGGASALPSSLPCGYIYRDISVSDWVGRQLTGGLRNSPPIWCSLWSSPPAVATGGAIWSPCWLFYPGGRPFDDRCSGTNWNGCHQRWPVRRPRPGNRLGWRTLQSTALVGWLSVDFPRGRSAGSRSVAKSLFGSRGQRARGHRL